MTKYLEWKVNTPGLLQEVLSNPSSGILVRPIQIFASILAQVAGRAIELSDPKLNELMLRLNLYESATAAEMNSQTEILKESE
jgi:hypothetical protein